MRIVGLGLSEPSPADNAARPVTLARQLLGHEPLEANRLRSFPVALVITIVRNAGVRAAAGTRQDKEPLVPFAVGNARACRRVPDHPSRSRDRRSQDASGTAAGFRTRRRRLERYNRAVWNLRTSVDDGLQTLDDPFVVLDSRPSIGDLTDQSRRLADELP
jgi:hypothetical protein